MHSPTKIAVVMVVLGGCTDTIEDASPVQGAGEKIPFVVASVVAVAETEPDAPGGERMVTRVIASNKADLCRRLSPTWTLERGERAITIVVPRTEPRSVLSVADKTEVHASTFTEEDLCRAGAKPTTASGEVEITDADADSVSLKLDLQYSDGLHVTDRVQARRCPAASTLGSASCPTE